MNTRQKSKFKMFVAVNTFLNSKATLVNPLPNYSDSFTAFSTGIEQIKVFSEEQVFDKSGLSKSKINLKGRLVMLAADTSRKLQVYARFTNNQLLLSEIAYTESSLKKARNNELVNYSKGVYNRAQTNITELETYGINAESQTLLSEAINSFVEAIPKPRIARAAAKKYTREMAITFKNTDKALSDIDAAIEIIKLKEPEFYNEYKTVRKIILQGTGSLSLKGQINDSVTKEPVTNVDIVFTLNENGSLRTSSNGEIMKKSARKGGFWIKSLEKGIYKVKISKNGYTDQETTIAVTNGEMARLNVELVKN